MRMPYDRGDMNQDQSSNITWHEGQISRADRQHLLNQKGGTLWFTGLSGSGKSTVACAVEKTLLERGINAYRLDGDNVRHGLNGNLGFSDEDRTENIRRIGEVAKLFADASVLTLASFISPFRVDRERVRNIHEEAGLAFIEVYVKCPLEVAEKRDPKGLYKKARAGEIKEFTGLDSPYEEPEAAEVVIDTAEMSIDQCVERVIEALKKRGLI